MLFQKTTDLLNPFRVENKRDPTTLAPIAVPNRTYTETVPGVWIDLKYEGGNGNDPLWESALLRPAFRTLFADWANGGLDFPDLGDGTSPDPNAVVIAKNEIASHATAFGPDVPDNQLDIPIPAALETAILAGLRAAGRSSADTIESVAPLQVEIPGIDKSLAELINLAGRSRTRFGSRSSTISRPTVTTWSAAPRRSASCSSRRSTRRSACGTSATARRFEFDLDLRALFAANDVPLKLNDGDGGFGLEIDGTLDVGGSDRASSMPRPACCRSSPSASNSTTSLADRRPLLHPRRDLAAERESPTPTTWTSARGWGSCRWASQNGSIDLDADVDVDLTVLDADQRTRRSRSARSPPTSATSTRKPSGTLDGELPIVVELAGILTLPARRAGA